MVFSAAHGIFSSIRSEWSHGGKTINRVQRDVDLLNYGGTIFYIGGVHQR
jgi:hypothetical protein